MNGEQDSPTMAVGSTSSDDIIQMEENAGATNKKEEELAKAISIKELRLSCRRVLLLIVAVTVHNIPEGLAVGIAFGSSTNSTKATFEAARNLALGMGLQNFPEGLAVSLPLAGFGYSKLWAFFFGQLSGIVEPIAALVGAGLVVIVQPVLPYALGFGAGAMVFVVVDDIVPEAQMHGHGNLASIACIVGFVIMMALDVGLG